MHDDWIYCITVVSMRNIEMWTQTGSVEFEGTQHTDMSKGPGKFCSEANKRIYIPIYSDIFI